ncbi:hypothetical protein PV04_00216 [Phialophora macrospora]|uniref:Uncharacterized protein n=1 Tax=Phialophora macrospora TaxID=1851006 RepID=A0A0D2ECM1_9EURO|nr:hypothetical protein PV04_00216 [Phialophora macrospora]
MPKFSKCRSPLTPDPDEGDAALCSLFTLDLREPTDTNHHSSQHGIVTVSSTDTSTVMRQVSFYGHS